MPVISKANSHFDVLTYTGNGSTQNITGLNFQPDFVWVKSRSNAVNHSLYDSIRGAGNVLFSNATEAEVTGVNDMTGFLSNGISVAYNSRDEVNRSGYTYVAWCWKASGSTVTNTAGTYSAQVRANPTAGFSVVTYTLSSATSAIETFGHGLGVAPNMVIIKVRGQNDSWTVYHSGLSTPNNNWLTLNNTDGTTGSTSTFSSSSTTFGVRGTRLLGSGSGNILAYCFAEVAGYSKFGSYTGNGSTNGPFVYTGFRPRYIMAKPISGAGNWNLIDTARSPFNLSSNLLRMNSSDGEFSEPSGTYGIALDAVSNGFKLRSGSGTNDINQTSATYVYMAFAENPFKYASSK